jgi:hypothetical protein
MECAPNTWKNGRMEHWNDGIKEKESGMDVKPLSKPIFQYSIIPVFQGEGARVTWKLSRQMR